MPFVRMDLLKGRSKEELRRISRSVHQAMTEAIDVPEDDYFQVITQHDEEEFFFDPSYMNIKRTKDLIYIHITMKERPIEKSWLCTNALQSVCKKTPASAKRTS